MPTISSSACRFANARSGTPFGTRPFLACLLWAACAFATAQSYPTKPVRIISPFPAGLGPDVAIRVVAEGLSATWGQPVIVDARPGANGFIAIEAAKKASPDGYMLLNAGQAHLAINPKLFRKVSYDPEKDFVPISTYFRAPFFIVLPSSGPHRDLRDLIAYAKSNPGKLTYSSPYVGSPGHLGTELLAYLTGTQMLHVPYKEASQVYTSVATGEVNWSMGSIGSLTPMLRAGRIRMVAIAAKARLASHSDVPTVAEAGGPPNFLVDVWGGLVAPAGTGPDIVNQISAVLGRVLARPDTIERFRGMGLEAVASTPAETAGFVRADAKLFGDQIARIGIAAD